VPQNTQLVTPDEYHPARTRSALQERQALAVMDHPVIARVLDAGNCFADLSISFSEIVMRGSILEAERRACSETGK
jgi:hypothetical protein